MLREPTRDVGKQARPTVRSRHVTANVWVPKPVELTSKSDREAEGFTKDAFEGALDKVSRPTGRGKLAHLRPNSEEFARRKQEEIDLEERSR